MPRIRWISVFAADVRADLCLLYGREALLVMAHPVIPSTRRQSNATRAQARSQRENDL